MLVQQQKGVQSADAFNAQSFAVSYDMRTMHGPGHIWQAWCWLFRELSAVEAAYLGQQLLLQSDFCDTEVHHRRLGRNLRLEVRIRQLCLQVQPAYKTCLKAGIVSPACDH